MPDTLSLSVSTGVSFGLLAGIVSGVCYLVANGFVWPHSRGGGKTERGRVLREVREDTVEGGECAECGRRILTSAAASTGSPEDGCECEEQYREVKFEEGYWFLKQVQKTLSFIPWSISTDKLDTTGDEDGGRGGGGGGAGGTARTVRDFVEQLSARLAGGALDRTSVASIYHHAAYLPSVRDGVRGGGGGGERETGGASGAHAQLKRLVRRVVEEAMSLPALAHYAHDAHSPRAPPDEDTFDARTYEDLLATAILNKVIERYQTESAGGLSGGASSGIHSASASPTPSAPSSSSVSPPHSAHTPPPLHDDDDEDRSDSDWEHDDAPELPRRVPFPEFGGDIIHLTDNMGVEPDQYLEEISGSDLQASDGTWEENWLFQKKKVKTLQSVPVPMLVPNPGSDYRAMIGDRDADDTTDLSEAATDSDDEAGYKSDIQRTVQSKTLIGGKTPIGQLLSIDRNDRGAEDDTNQYLVNRNLESDLNESHKKIEDATEVQEITADFNSSNSESVIVVGVDSGPLNKTEFTVEEIHRTPNAIGVGQDDSDGVMVSAIKTQSINRENPGSLTNHQREGEYEEAISLPVQRYADSLRRQHYPPPSSPLFNGNDTGTSTNDNNHEDDLIPGSIADRERKKWLNYVEMPNNPYSAEAIQKRLSHKSTSAIFDFLTTRTSNDEKVKDNQRPDDRPATDSPPSSPSPKILKDVLAEEVPQYKRYGRDYYINEAKKSAGGRKKNYLSETSSLSSMNKSTSLDNFDINEFTSPGELIQRFNSMEVEQKYKDAKLINRSTKNSITISNKTNNDKNMISIEYEDVREVSLFAAKAVFINDDTDQKFEDILRSAKQDNIIDELPLNVNFRKPQDADSNGIDESFLSTSSLEDSIKIYNVPKGEIVKKSRDIQHLTGRESLPDVDNNDNVVTIDNTPKEAISRSSKHGKVAVDASSDEMITNSSANLKNIDDLNIMLPKVKDLAKKFVQSENYEEPQVAKTTPRRRKFSNEYELEVVNKYDQKSTGKNQMYMHSLTARSISKEFREELKLSMATPIKIPGGTNELPEGIEDITSENVSPDSPVPQPGTLKNKLAFFESLKC